MIFKLTYIVEIKTHRSCDLKNYDSTILVLKLKLRRYNRLWN